MGLSTLLAEMSAAEAGGSSFVLLRELAEELAHELTRRRPGTLRSWQSKVARAAAGASDSFARGYLEAVADVAAHFEAALSPLLEEESLARWVRRQEWVLPYLLTLRGGAHLPSEVASQRNDDPALVSRRLARLREAGLVETEAAGSQDGRTRPHHLTLKGEELAARVSVELPAETAQVIRAVVELVRLLTVSSGASAPFLQEIVEGTLRSTALSSEEIVRQCLEALGPPVDKQGIAVASKLGREPPVCKWIERLLSRATDPWVQQFLSLGKPAPLLVRSEWDAARWNTALSRWAPGEPHRAVSSSELKVDLEELLRGPRVLVYESDELLRADRALKDREHIAKVEERSVDRLCVVASDVPLEGGYRPFLLPQETPQAAP